MQGCFQSGLFRLAVLTSLLAVACTHGPVLDTGPRPVGVGGTIAGIVSAEGGTVSLPGRKVTAINDATGAKFEVTTATDGGYTIKVPTGTYRLEVEMRPGESLAKSPDPTQVNTGDLDPDRNFVVARR